MSHYTEERYAVYNELCVTARKEHTCRACGILIPKGGRYWRVTWVYDGSAGGVKRCLACQFTHEHLRCLGDGEMWPDEELNCGESYEEHWGDLPEEVGVMAFWKYGDRMPQTESCTSARDNMYPPIWRGSNHYMRGAERCLTGTLLAASATERCS